MDIADYAILRHPHNKRNNDSDMSAAVRTT